MSDNMQVELPVEQMLILSQERNSVRLELPPLQLEGVPQPVNIHLDFDMAMVDEILEWLTKLRAQMSPAPRRN